VMASGSEEDVVTELTGCDDWESPVKTDYR